MDLRYLPDRPLPAYAFVPGRHPHPVRDPGGHLYGQQPDPPLPLNLQRPHCCEDFLLAVDLFNLGYYWEAHEVWEGLWHAEGRTGPVATMLKGLIKLAAAGVKAREGNLAGVQRHATRAAELLSSVAELSGAVRQFFDALHGDILISCCRQLAEHPVSDATPTVAGLPVLGLRIDLAD